MAKYFLYLFLICALILALEFFKIVDVPYLEIPDWVSGAEDLMHKSSEKVDEIK